MKTTVASTPKAPIPRPNPLRLVAATVTPPATRLPATRNEGETRTASLPPAGAPHREDPVCVNALMDASVQFKVMPSNESGACGAVQPLQVSASLRDGGVKFSPSAVMVCSQTRAVLEWIEKEVQPAAVTHLGAPVTAIEVASSYMCRGRNNVAGAKLSEHAAANALDVGGFQIGTGKQARSVKVVAHTDPEDPEAKFLDAVRKGACLHFTTVLGPGQPAHETHFHFDNAVRGRAGNHRLCQ